MLNLFAASPEGQARLQADPDMGFWIARLIEYGVSYLSVALPDMTVEDVDEIVTELTWRAP